MLKRKKHPDKEIEDAVRYTESLGWRYKKAGGSAHAWARLLCPLQAREGCIMSVWSTPRDADVHAKQIRRYATTCPHLKD